MSVRVQHLTGGLTNLKQIVAAGFAMSTTFLAVELTTGQIVIGGVLALCSAVLAAFLSSLPNIIKERSASRHREEASRIAYYREQLALESQKLLLIRNSKHNLLAHIQECHAHIGKLRMHVPNPPPFEFKYYDELCGDEDRALAMLSLPPDIHASLGPDAKRGS